MTKLSKNNGLFWVALGSVSASGILLSQNLVALITLPVLIGYILVIGISNKSIKYTLSGLLSIIWGFAIASITYLPSLFERDFIRLDEIIKDAYSNHFVTLKQLIYSPWGYGFDYSGTVNDEISFQVGLAHLIVLMVAVVITIYYYLKRALIIKKTRQIFVSKIVIFWQMLGLFFLITLTASVILMVDTKFAHFIWDRFKFIQIIDIPWRFLGVSTLALSFLASFVAKFVKSGFIFILLVIAVLVANRNHLRINKTVILSDDFFLNYEGTATQYGEFTPRWRETVAIPNFKSSKLRALRTSGVVLFKNVISNSNYLSFDAKVTTKDSYVRINKFYFPGVEVIVDGQRLELFKDIKVGWPGELKFRPLKEDNSGLMFIKLKNGDHKVNIAFGETPLRLFADYLTLGTLILAVGAVFKNAKK